MPQAGFDPPGEKWQLCLNIVVALPPKPQGWIPVELFAEVLWTVFLFSQSQFKYIFPVMPMMLPKIQLVRGHEPYSEIKLSKILDFT